MEVVHAGRQTKKRRTRSQSAIAVNACTPSSSWQMLTLRSKPNHITNRQCSHIFHCNIGLCEIVRSEEHTSELQSLMRISYAVFCLKKKTNKKQTNDK